MVLLIFCFPFFWLKIFEVAPTFFMVDIQKAAGDASEYLKVSLEEFLLRLLIFSDQHNSYVRFTPKSALALVFCSFYILAVKGV